MNQFFEGLANQNNANVSSTDVKDNFSIRAGGSMIITKGIVSRKISYWADVYKSHYPGYVSIDDLDYEEDLTYINGIKIDSMSKFNEGMANMGLSSISVGLQITSDEVKNEIYKAVNNSEAYKVVFTNLELFDLLSKDEKSQVVLDYAINNYDKTSEWMLKQYGLIESSSTKPTFEEFMENLNNK
jgi:hypothetical protein